MKQDSMWTGLRLGQVRLIATYWVRFSLRTGGGLIALLVILVGGLSVAGIFIAPVEELMKASPEVGHTEQEAAATVKELAESEQFVDLVRRVLGQDETEVRYLLQDNPALLSVIFIVMLWLFPFVSCVGSFNQTAGDIGSRGLRYLLLRTERPNILLGRFVGTVGAAKLAAALMFTILLLYIGLKLAVYPSGDLIVWGVQGFIAIVLLSLPYVAMCTWVSSLLDSAFGALALCLVLAVAPILLLKALAASIPGDAAWLDRLIPWGWKYDLLSADPTTRLVGYAVMLGFSLAFLGLALWTFHKRDL